VIALVSFGLPASHIAAQAAAAPSATFADLRGLQNDCARTLPRVRRLLHRGLIPVAACTSTSPRPELGPGSVPAGSPPPAARPIARPHNGRVARRPLPNVTLPLEFPHAGVPRRNGEPLSFGIKDLNTERAVATPARHLAPAAGSAKLVLGSTLCSRPRVGPHSVWPAVLSARTRRIACRRIRRLSGGALGGYLFPRTAVSSWYRLPRGLVSCSSE